MLQGLHATNDEITACAYQAVTVDNKYNGAPVQVRVVMGKEPRHFLAMFKGKLIIFEVEFFTLETVIRAVSAQFLVQQPEGWHFSHVNYVSRLKKVWETPP